MLSFMGEEDKSPEWEFIMSPYKIDQGDNMVFIFRHVVTVWSSITLHFVFEL